jgi:predicted metalloprotease
MCLALMSCGDASPSPGSGGVSGGGFILPTSVSVPPTMASSPTPQPRASNKPNLRNDKSFDPPTRSGAVFTSSQSGTSQQAAVYDYLVAVMGDADKKWTSWFLRSGFKEPMVYYEIVSNKSTIKTACPDAEGVSVIASTYNNAFYCTADSKTINGVRYDGSIVLPLDTFIKMWKGDVFSSKSKKPGDFAAATILAHEFGHHVIDELILQRGFESPSRPNQELIADCLSGVWAHSAYTDNYLEEGDIDEAIQGLRAIGDFNVKSPDHHGTPADRENAWRIGFYGSNANPVQGWPQNCFDAYWFP